MYYDYFELKQPPFRITPDTSLFFPGGNRGAILNAMMYAITSGEGIVKVVGEVGSGKTMLCRMLALELPDNVEIVYLANPSLSPDNILHAIAFELKLRVKPDDDRLRVMQKLQQYLVKRHSENKQVVVFVEEAQSMPIATLEEIRLLSNLETKEHKLLQIVLFGQPELDQMIARKEIRQLKERITYTFNLNPLNVNEVRDYINTRLRACGYRSGDLFSNAAIREITHYSRGLLRRINILADKAMLSAYASNSHRVNTCDVRTAARDSEFVSVWQQYRYANTVLGFILLLIFTGLIILFGDNNPLFNKQEDQPLVKKNEVDVASQDQHKEYTENTHTPLLNKEKIKNTIYLPQDETRYYDYRRPGSAYSPKDEAAVNSNLVTGPLDNESPSVADYLLDQEHYAQIVEVGESSMSSEETELLMQQLKLLPPETVLSTQAGAECRVCTSIIYRPIKNGKNL